MGSKTMDPKIIDPKIMDPKVYTSKMIKGGGGSGLVSVLIEASVVGRRGGRGVVLI